MLRDPGFIKGTLKQLPSGEYITTTGCHIHVPSRFEERGLAVFGAETYCYGMLAIIVDDKYSVMKLCGMLKLNPTSTTTTTIGESEYKVMEFEKDSVVIEQSDIVQQNVLIFNLMDELMFKGKVPWYMDYDDMGQFLDTAGIYGGSTIGSNLTVIELLVSIMARNTKDLSKFYRDGLKDTAVSPKFIGLTNVQLIAGNTLNRLVGSHMGDGLVSALVNETKEVGQLERLLRA